MPCIHHRNRIRVDLLIHPSDENWAANGQPIGQPMDELVNVVNFIGKFFNNLKIHKSGSSQPIWMKSGLVLILASCQHQKICRLDKNSLQHIICDMKKSWVNCSLKKNSTNLHMHQAKVRSIQFQFKQHLHLHQGATCLFFWDRNVP